MPNVRYLKVFRGTPKYNNADELDNVEGLAKIEVNSFPHTERDIHVLGLIGIEPQFYGQFVIKFPDTPNDYVEMTVQNPGKELLWAVLNQAKDDITFQEAGSYVIELLLDGVPFHSITLKVKLKMR